LLLEYGADARATDADGRTALLHAVLAHSWPPRLHRDDRETEEERTIRLLLEAGSDPRVNWGGTPLHLTVSGRCARWLLQAGADKEALDHEEKTPLMRAAEEGHLETVRVLLEAGADVYAGDDDYNALTLAQESLGHAMSPYIMRDLPDDEEVPRLQAIIALLEEARMAGPTGSAI
jgi:ankyrin repeat protein